MFKDMLVAAVKGLLQTAVRMLLSSVKEHNPKEDYVNAIKSIVSTMSLLKKLTAKTKTTIDDTAVDIFLIPAREAATEDGIPL